MTNRTDKPQTAIDHSELLNNKRPDIDARLIRDIVRAGIDHEINVCSVEPHGARNPRYQADLCSSTGDAA